MSTLIFGIDIAGELAGAVTASDLPPVTLRKLTFAALPANQLTRTPTTTPTDYLTWGIEAAYVLKAMPSATDVQEGDKGVMMIGKPLNDAGVEPKINDYVIVDGKTYTIVAVDRDPAKAQYMVQARG